MGVRRLRLVLDRAITSCVAVSEDETLLLGRGLLICEDSKSNLSGLLWELHGIAALKTKIKIKLVHGKHASWSYAKEPELLEHRLNVERMSGRSSSQTICGMMEILDLILQIREVSEEFQPGSAGLPIGKRDYSNPERRLIVDPAQPHVPPYTPSSLQNSHKYPASCPSSFSLG